MIPPPLRMSDQHAPAFRRYVGIDYSGAATPMSSLPGLRVFLADVSSMPSAVPPPTDRSRHWTRLGIAQWLAELISEDVPTLIGIDHGFSFPLRYFEQHDLPHDWSAFLDDFCRHWPTDNLTLRVEHVRTGVAGNGAARSGNAKWRRLTEIRAGAAKSVFHFDVQGSVAKSTHAGLPWLRFIRCQQPDRVHVWPFDGWTPPIGKSVIAEVYPSLWSRSFPMDGRTPDQHDAWSVAEWMRRTDRDGELAQYFMPNLSPEHQAAASIEGWILGLLASPDNPTPRTDTRRSAR